MSRKSLQKENSRSSELQVIQWCSCQETHKNGGLHYHLALKVNKYQRWMNSKRYLQDRYGINVHYSARHNNYFSTWKYVTKSDKDYIESQDHPGLNDYPSPRTDAASRGRRGVRAYNLPRLYWHMCVFSRIFNK